MARARNIKPGFFANEELAELPFETRLLFVGLWTLADRAGRLELRPKKIKAAVFPYDDLNVIPMLAALVERGFLIRYDAAGRTLLQVDNWPKHQNPHPKERASEWPGPNNDVSSTLLAAEIPERAGLIPDSGFLIPDTKDSKSKVARKRAQLGLPHWLDVDAWNEWQRFRQAKRGWTDHARALSLRTLEKLYLQGHDPRAVIEQSIERGWTGLFELKSAGGRHGNSVVEDIEQNIIRARRARGEL